jgi:hypothetical protein
MSRRPDPQRIDDARRAALHSRLTGEGMSDDRADEGIARWQAQAARDGVERGSGYWSAGWAWISIQRGTRR